MVGVWRLAPIPDVDSSGVRDRKAALRRDWPRLATALGRPGGMPRPDDAGQLLPPALDEYWSAAWRESLVTEPGQSREERAEAVWVIYRLWAQGDR